MYTHLKLHQADEETLIAFNHDIDKIKEQWHFLAVFGLVTLVLAGLLATDVSWKKAK